MRTTRRRKDTPPAATAAGERDVLVGFLDYLRAAVAAKAEDAPEPASRTAGVASGTNLLGLVAHLTSVERYWLLGEPVRDWPATFHPAPDQTAASIVAEYRRSNAAANERITSWTDLAAAGPRPGGRGDTSPPSRRWTLTHLIEETARHAGHADILRELIDGATGR